MIEVDCRKCVHCTGEYCEVYGNDAAYAISKCTEDLFEHYIIIGKSENTVMKEVDYTIFSKPYYIMVDCPHCGETVYPSFCEIDFFSDYWGDGGVVDCPECNQEITLGDYYYE